MIEKRKSPLFDIFWENTNLNDKNSLKFFKGFKNEEHEVEQIKYSICGMKLKKPKDKLIKIMENRHSERIYNNYKLSKKQLSSLFSCFSSVDNYHRLLPSGGAKYPIEVYALCFNVKELSGKIVYYNYKENSLSIVGECDEWKNYTKLTGADGVIEGTPSILFLFVAFPNRTISKYGERGGRFVLIESGHYLQNLSLRISYENLKGVELGGLYDNEFKKILKLDNTDAIITLGMLCGK